MSEHDEQAAYEAHEREYLAQGRCPDSGTVLVRSADDGRLYCTAAVMAIFECEVDVVRERAQRPWRVRTHHVSVAVEDRPSWVRMENEARNLAAWMCWHVRGEIVTAVRIVAVVI